MQREFTAGLLRGIGQVLPFLLLLLAAHRLYPPVDTARLATREDVAALASEVRALKGAKPGPFGRPGR